MEKNLKRKRNSGVPSFQTRREETRLSPRRVGRFNTALSRNTVGQLSAPKQIDSAVSTEVFMKSSRPGVTKPTGLHSSQLSGCCQLLSRQCRSCVAISSYIWLLGLRRLCLLPSWVCFFSPIGWWYIPIL